MRFFHHEGGIKQVAMIDRPIRANVILNLSNHPAFFHGRIVMALFELLKQLGIREYFLHFKIVG